MRSKQKNERNKDPVLLNEYRRKERLKKKRTEKKQKKN